jgi:RNA polymerase sigma-70 factor, ECF subfamily
MNPAGAARTYAHEGTDDLALIGRVAAGDESAFSTLFDRWQRVVSALADRILSDADEADDVVEETFWQAWRGAARFDASRGSVQTWLLTIARTRSLDRLRARRRRREESADEQDEDGSASIASLAADPGGDTSAGAEQNEQSGLIRVALAGLPPEQRTTLELAYFSGLSQTEIAVKMNEPLGTVKTRTRMALQKLRGALAGLREDSP